MHIARLKLVGMSLEKLVDHLTTSFQIDYINISNDMAVLANENLYLRNSSTQLDMLVIKVQEGDLHVDLIGGAGGAGLFNFNFGSEKSFTKRATKIIRDYCAIHQIEVVAIK
jgi:hypothetical protein